MLRRYLLAIKTRATEHPHKLPDLFVKELAELPQRRPRIIAALFRCCQQLNFVAFLHPPSTSRCEAAYYTAMIPAVNPLSKTFFASGRHPRLPFRLSGRRIIRRCLLPSSPSKKFFLPGLAPVFPATSGSCFHPGNQHGSACREGAL